MELLKYVLTNERSSDEQEIGAVCNSMATKIWLQK